MGLSFHRLLLFEGLFEVASLGPGSSLARFLSSPLSAPRRRREKEAPSSGKPLAIQLPMAPLSPACFSKSPQSLLRFPPPTGRRQGGPLPSFFSNLPAVSRRQAVACLLGRLSLQACPGLREQRRAHLGDLTGGGWAEASGTGSAPRGKSRFPNTGCAH